MLDAPQSAGTHEDGGDAQDGSFAEDEEAGAFAHLSDGLGCVIADPDAEHDGRENDDGF